MKVTREDFQFSSSHTQNEPLVEWAPVFGKERLFLGLLDIVVFSRLPPPLPSPFKQCPRPNSLYFLPLSDVSHRAIFPVVLQVHRGGEGVVTSQLQRARLWHSSLTISLTKPSCLACYWAAHPFSPPMSLLLLFLLFPGQLLNIFRGLIR